MSWAAPLISLSSFPGSSAGSRGWLRVWAASDIPTSRSRASASHPSRGSDGMPGVSRPPQRLSRPTCPVTTKMVAGMPYSPSTGAASSPKLAKPSSKVSAAASASSGSSSSLPTVTAWTPDAASHSTWRRNSSGGTEIGEPERSRECQVRMARMLPRGETGPLIGDHVGDDGGERGAGTEPDGPFQFRERGHSPLHILESLRIGLSVGHQSDLRAASGRIAHHFGQPEDGHLFVGAYVEDFAYAGRRGQQPEQGLYRVLHMPETARLGSVAVNGDRL